MCMYNPNENALPSPCQPCRWTRPGPPAMVGPTRHGNGLIMLKPVLSHVVPLVSPTHFSVQLKRVQVSRSSENKKEN